MSLTKFHLSRLTLAITLVGTSTLAFSAGLDRSRQDIKAFFQEGTYAEVTAVTVNPNISGYDNAAEAKSITDKNVIVGASKDEAGYVKGKEVRNITKDPYNFIRYGVKTDVNDNVSVGILYDEPWGANVSYHGKNNFVSNPNQHVKVTDEIPALPMPAVNPNTAINETIGKPVNEDYIANTNVNLHTQTWTGLIGVKKDGFQVYGGPVLQKAKAKLQLRGSAFGPMTGYDAVAGSDNAMGWAGGVSYSKPEIKLNAAVTYHSPIEHEIPIAESIPLLSDGFVGDKAKDKLKAVTGTPVDKISKNTLKNITVKTPESVNINLQSGLSEKYQLLGMLDARWVPWSKMNLTPPSYNAVSKIKTKDDVGLPILSYDKDQYTVEAGLAKRFNDKLAGSVQLGWDSGTGEEASALGPVNGYYSVGGGVKYNVTPEWALSAGAKYLKFGDATAKLPTGDVVGKFEDNNGFVAGVKVSYQSED